MKLEILINPKQLLNQHQFNPSDLIIIDAGNFARYKKEHLDGAIHLDLNEQLSDIKENAANGGRHPLPSSADFTRTLGSLGINSSSHIIIYDENKCTNASARLWWMLNSIGHQKVQVLDGGLQAAQKIGFPANDLIIQREPTNYPVSDWKLPQATIDEVEKASKDDTYLIIDVRAKERYDGISEPIDLIAGHIPNAVNVPLTENLDENGCFLTPELLKEKYEEVTNGTTADKTIVHCGSGVTACHTLLSFATAGLEIPKLYVGSWSEWSRNEKEMITK